MIHLWVIKDLLFQMRLKNWEKNGGEKPGAATVNPVQRKKARWNEGENGQETEGTKVRELDIEKGLAKSRWKEKKGKENDWNSEIYFASFEINHLI